MHLFKKLGNKEVLNDMEKKKRTIIIFLGVATLIIVGLICLVKMQKSKLNILVVGDSIGAGAGASETDKKWFRLLEKDLESKGISVEIDNPSLGGNTSFAGFCMVEEADPEKNYDAIFVCFGENDSETDFELYYENIFNSIKRKYPEALLYVILESSQREYTWKMERVIEIANHYDAYVIDTIAAFDESGIDYELLSDDGIHPNDEGQNIYYEKAIAAVDGSLISVDDGHASIKEKDSKKTEVYTPIDESLNAWKDYQIISKEEMKKVDETTLEITLPVGKYAFGYHMDCIDGDQSIKVYDSDELLCERSMSRAMDSPKQEFYMIASKDVVLSGEEDKILQMRFSTKEQMEAFYGLCCVTLK